MNNECFPAIVDELRRLRHLVELIAEPAIAQRDHKLRERLRSIVGTSTKKQKSVLLMDGTRTQTQIVSETSVNQGDLSTMVGKLDSAGLLADGKKQPKLSISVPANFFDSDGKNH